MLLLHVYETEIVFTTDVWKEIFIAGVWGDTDFFFSSGVCEEILFTAGVWREILFSTCVRKEILFITGVWRGICFYYRCRGKIFYFFFLIFRK